MAPPAKEDRTDFPLVVMGLLFLSMALVEFFVPAGSEGDRGPIKALCGAQIVFALTVSFLDRRPRASIFKDYAHNALLFLFVWMCGASVLGGGEMRIVLGGCVMFFYWYSMFVFFYSRSAGGAGQNEIFLLVVTASLFVWVLALRRSVAVQMDLVGREGEQQIQNYIGYYVIGLLPFVILLRNRVLRVIALGLISYGAIYSLKRGVMLALALTAVGSTFVYLFFVCTAKERRRGIAAVLVVWVLGMGAAASFYFINPEAVTRRLTAGSNREEVYSATISGIQKSDAFEAIVGHGFLKSLDDTGRNAHNDWLLLQYDYGFVGVLLMFNVYVALLALLWKLCKTRSPLAVSLACCIILVFCVQMYSTGLYQKIFGFVFGGIGLVAGSRAANQQNPETTAQRT